MSTRAEERRRDNGADTSLCQAELQECATPALPPLSPEGTGAIGKCVIACIRYYAPTDSRAGSIAVEAY